MFNSTCRYHVLFIKRRDGLVVPIVFKKLLRLRKKITLNLFRRDISRIWAACAVDVVVRVEWHSPASLATRCPLDLLATWRWRLLEKIFASETSNVFVRWLRQAQVVFLSPKWNRTRRESLAYTFVCNQVVDEKCTYLSSLLTVYSFHCVQFPCGFPSTGYRFVETKRSYLRNWERQALCGTVESEKRYRHFY